MSKINEYIGKPQKVSINGMPPVDARLTFETHKVENDKDTQELIEVFASGVDIVLQVEGDKCTYVIIKKVEQLKVALAS